jgi:hypothetical protein
VLKCELDLGHACLHKPAAHPKVSYEGEREG